MVKKVHHQSHQSRRRRPKKTNNKNKNLNTQILLICSLCLTVYRVGHDVSLQHMYGELVEDLPTLLSTATATVNNAHSNSILQQQQNHTKSDKEKKYTQQPQVDYQKHEDYYSANEKTWALVTPPGLMGGYRNQVFRLFGMMIAAKRQNVHQILYPSILWTTWNENSQQLPVPMEDLFDIDHWNHHIAVQDQKEMPRLVSHIGQTGGDCWSSSSSPPPRNSSSSSVVMESNNHQLYPNPTDDPLLERVLKRPRFLTPVANISWGYTTGQIALNPRRFDITPHIQHCRNPVAFGAGGGRGILWTTYMSFSKSRPRDKTTGYIDPHPLEQSFLQALKPLPKWRKLAQQCVQEATSTSTTTSTTSSTDTQQLTYIALHPRVETEMMVHTCGIYMNKNLTSIFEYVQDFLNNQTETLGNVTGIFVAMSRTGASVTSGKPYQRFRGFIDENIQTMNRVMGKESFLGQGLTITNNASPAAPGGNDYGGTKTRQIPVFECGDQLVQRYYESQPDDGQPVVKYGSLLPSVINFDVAVEAAAFVGVRASSWSNSVWTTRYYLGKGQSNYEYTRERGIVPIENGGLPQPHKNCDEMSDPG